jgi:integrase
MKQLRRVATRRAPGGVKARTSAASTSNILRAANLDERRQRVRLRSGDDEDPQGAWVEVSPERDEGIRALRSATSIAKACKAAGITLWSPHDLRHRISLLHLRGVPWARIAEFVGQRDLTVRANTYTSPLCDERSL